MPRVVEKSSMVQSTKFKVQSKAQIVIARRVLSTLYLESDEASYLVPRTSVPREGVVALWRYLLMRWRVLRSTILCVVVFL